MLYLFARKYWLEIGLKRLRDYMSENSQTIGSANAGEESVSEKPAAKVMAVSYTHLTLPTIYPV